MRGCRGIPGFLGHGNGSYGVFDPMLVIQIGTKAQAPEWLKMTQAPLRDGAVIQGFRYLKQLNLP